MKPEDGDLLMVERLIHNLEENKMDLTHLVGSVRMLRQCPELMQLPEAKLVKLFKGVIQNLSKLEIPKLSMVDFVHDVNEISLFVQEEMSRLLPSETILNCLYDVYQFMCNKAHSYGKGIALAAILDRVPDEFIIQAIQFILSDPTCTDAHVISTLKTLCFWVKGWPKTTQLSHWIICIFKQLNKKRKYDIIDHVVLNNIDNLFQSLLMPLYREAVFPVVVRMLLGSHINSPIILQKIAPKVADVIVSLNKEIDVLVGVVEVLQVLIMRFHDCPEAKDVHSAIHTVPLKIPSETLQALLDCNVWVLPMTNVQLSAHVTTGVVLIEEPIGIIMECTPTKRSETGQVGLYNLGNTCYMNSVVQALYMTDTFSHAVLSAIPSVHEPMLSSLQVVFAFLAHSHRSAIWPHDFCTISRPAWFEVGRHQDCSEFLRVLLDVLHEQEQKRLTGIRSLTAKEIEEEKCDPMVAMEIGSSSECIADDPLETEDEPRSPPLCTTLFNSNGVGIEFVDEEDEEEGVGGSDTDVEMETTNAGDASLKRWTTCENLTSGQGFEQVLLPPPLTPLDDPLVDKTSLNDSHSNSTDSGIQSVGEMTTEQQHCPSHTEVVPHTIVQHVFGGSMATMVKCLACQTESIQEGSFTDMHLAFPDNPPKKGASLTALGGRAVGGYSLRSRAKASTSRDDDICSSDVGFSLEELVDYYLAAELLEGSNQYACAKCNGLRDAERSMRVTKSPDHLILTLLRFEYDKETQQRHKLFTEVTFPETLQLPIGYTPSSQLKRNSAALHSNEVKHEETPSNVKRLWDTYALYAVVVHSGSTSDAGHWYTFAKHPATHSPNEDCQYCQSNQWFTFNDDGVSFCNLNQLQKVSKNSPQDVPYVLFYRRVSVEPSSTGEKCIPQPPLSSLPPRVYDSVEKDNAEFHRSERVVTKRANVASSNVQSHWKDHRDDDDNPPSTCGGGGGLGMNSTFNNYVF